MGTKRTLTSENYEKCAEILGKHKIQGLVVVGGENSNCFVQYSLSFILVIGFEAFESVLQMAESRRKYKEFRIPIVCLPATISNNIPGGY